MKNNIRLLTLNELQMFKEKYTFELEGLFVFVNTKNFNRTTIHPKNAAFSINYNSRKITITPETIELWENHFKNVNLIEVQNAVNRLVLMYQKPQVEDVAKILNNEI